MADEGFKISGAYVEVHLRDDTDTDYDRLKAKLQAKEPLEVRSSLDSPDNVRATRAKTQAALDAKPVQIPAKVDADSARKAGRDGGEAASGALVTALALGAPVAGAALAAGVGAGFVGLAALAQKSNEDVVDSYKELSSDVVSEVRGASDQLVPYLTAGARELDSDVKRLGPSLQQAFAAARPDVNLLVDDVDAFATRAMPGLVRAAQNSQPALRGMGALAGATGSALTSLLDGVTGHSDAAEGAMDAVAGTVNRLAADVGQLVGGALPGLEHGLQGLLGNADQVLDVLKPFTPTLGAIAGEVGPALGGFKLASLLSGPVDTLGGKVSGLATRAGTLTTSLTRSAAAGKAATSALSGLGSGIQSAAGYLPLAGAALALLDSQMVKTFGDADQLGQELLQGGQATQQAMEQMGSTSHQVLGFVLSNLPAAGGLLKSMIPTMADAEKGMTAVEKAQVAYNVAVAQFGSDSPQAKTALANFGVASRDAAGQQTVLSSAIATTDQKLAEQETALLSAVNADLGYQSAALNVTAAERTYAEAVKKSGAGSLSAKQAATSLGQALVQQVQDAGAAAVAHDSLGSASDKAKRQQMAETATILGLAAAAGNNAPPALRQMVAGLTDSQIAAFAATGKIAGTRQEVLRLPNGKTITIAVNSNGQAVTGATQRAIDHMHGRALPVTAVDRVTGTVNEIIRRNNGRVVHVEVSPSGGAISLFGHATGGIDLPAGRALAMAAGGVATPMSGSIATVVPPNVPRIIGDNRQVPEAFAPLDGSQRTRNILTDAARHEGLTTTGPPVTQNFYITQQPQEDGRVFAARVSADTTWRMATSVRG